jgi:hypothetical protein
MPAGALCLYSAGREIIYLTGLTRVITQSAPGLWQRLAKRWGGSGSGGPQATATIASIAAHMTANAQWQL